MSARTPRQVLLGLLLLLPATCLPLLGAEPAPLEATTRDLVVEAVPMPQAPEDQATIDWTNGVLRVSGTGHPSSQITNSAQRKATARTAARNVALRNLAYALQGAPVRSDATFAEYARRQGGVRIETFVRYDRVAEERAQADGSVVVTLELSFRDKPQLAQLLYAPGAKEEKRRVSMPPANRPAPAGLTSPQAPGPFSGLVVLTEGLGARAVLRPSLLDRSGKSVYGAGVAEAEEAIRHGLAAYARSLDGALATGRVGKTPLVIWAAGINQANLGELVLSDADARRVRAANAASGFLKRAAVVIVLVAAGPAPEKP